MIVFEPDNAPGSNGICYSRIGAISHGLTAVLRSRINYAVDRDLELFAFGFLAALELRRGPHFGYYIGSSDQRLFAAAPALRASHCCKDTLTGRQIAPHFDRDPYELDGGDIDVGECTKTTAAPRTPLFHDLRIRHFQYWTRK
ncbi:hypothetical protein BDZ89DRAFT_1068873, partial [Hymenopellis radicata]